MKEDTVATSAYSARPVPLAGRDGAEQIDRPDKPVEVDVIFTGLAGTERALEMASELTRDLNARVRLLVPQVVPYPLPLESPPIPTEFNERRCLALARQRALDTHVEIYMCRSAGELVLDRLAPGSLVIVGGPKRIWPTRESRLARRLRMHGHTVVFAHTRTDTSGSKEAGETHA